MHIFARILVIPQIRSVEHAVTSKETIMTYPFSSALRKGRRVLARLILLAVTSARVMVAPTPDIALSTSTVLLFMVII